MKFKIGDKVRAAGDPEAPVGVVSARVEDPSSYDEPMYTVKFSNELNYRLESFEESELKKVR